ncbi:MAG: ribonucleoside triphosphate reductase [Candidatus Margulisiibacteriota bacterium]|nr:ribonucleoside triphosphate reductase [Candidatus Margulisiibacteriota bacterium]
MEKIIKRNGRKVAFDQERITKAVAKAIAAVGDENQALATRLSDKVVQIIDKEFVSNIPSVEQIQDVVERVLMANGHVKVAKAYILYRRQRHEMRRLKSTFVEVESMVDDYLYQKDWRVRENSNMPFSYSGMMMHISGSIMANYTLDKIYPTEVADAHRNGDFHIHDLSLGIIGYCSGWSLKQLFMEGFNGVADKVESLPPKHLDTALLQMVNFLGTLQGEWAGAQAFNSVDTYLAPFVRKDKLSYDQVKQQIQKFVFNLNIASRWGGQAPFTNVTFDWVVPSDMADDPVIIGGKLQSSSYKEYQDEMDIINRAFIEVMTEGDKNGRPFTFPVPTYNITKEFDWDSPNAKLLFDMTAKYGLPYFQNFINSPLDPSDVRSMCCRLRLDLRELRRNTTGGLFGSGDSTGSIGVVTINLPRIGYQAKSEKEFMERLSHLMELAKVSLEIKREVVSKNMEDGLVPFTKRYLGTIRNHFSTIGLVGMNEALLNFMGKDIISPEGKEFAAKILKFMLAKLQDFQEETGAIFNLEATPAEGTTYRLAKMDKRKYPDIITSGEEAPYYTNSTHLPVGNSLGVLLALEHQNKLQTLYTGGTVFHIYLGERMPTAESTKNFIKKVAYNTNLPYFTLTPTYSICSEHGYIKGEHFACPACGLPTEVYTRVVGYFRSVKNWNEGKQEEYKERTEYKTEAVEIGTAEAKKRVLV